MEQYIREIFEQGFVKVVFSNGNYDAFYKVVLRPVQLKKQAMYQFESFTKTQAFHDNCNGVQAIERSVSIMDCMKQMDVFTDTECRSFKISKKGKILQSRHKQVSKKVVSTNNNRQKQYLFEEGVKVPAFVDLGIMSEDGSIIKSKYDKFKQINRFVQQVDDVIRGKNVQTLHVVDFGCGKSYLTFILYYYFTEVKHMQVHMVGLDLKEEVIKRCQAIAQRYGYDGLSFEIGDIAGYQPDFDVDMVISLHACDVATDFALANAIRWNATYILSVPCCQKEVNHTIHQDSMPILEYGLLKERYCSLVTDTLRAKTLEDAGYLVQVLEFIDDLHSPKNVLLRCVKKRTVNPMVLSDDLVKWVEDMKLKPTLWNELRRFGVL